jgi:type VI secretion system FHA domain protein
MTTLRLEIVGPQAAALGASAAKVFGAAGGTIGRVSDNDWVLPDPYISSRHARIHWRNGQFLIEDTSSNGVFINSPDRRLGRGQMHPLQGGDRIFIDAYEIRVTLAAAATTQESASPLANMFSEAKPARQSTSAQRIPEDPFGAEDPFRSTPQQKPARQTIPEDFSLGVSDPAQAATSGESIDPLELLGFQAKRPTQSVPKAEDLASRSPLNDHYKPPAPVITSPPKEPARTGSHAMIPDNYDPLSDSEPADSGSSDSADPFATRLPVTPPVRPQPGQKPARVTTTTAPMSEDNTVALPRNTASSVPNPPPVSTPTPPPTPARNIPTSAPPPAVRREPAAEGSLDFTAMLKGAGLEGVQVTPELAENFGRILRIVVGGLMDVLRTREQIKNEFRMRMTTFKSADNNPLKFSANVDDALHNLLVKRNSAYLGPAEAFEDAFADVRHHQMAMLAGVRVAFNAMLADFEPERLQETFDRQLKKGSLLSAPARLRYWELYRDKFHDMVKDPETNFRELFGDEFARAYEEQLESLKAVARAQRKQK